ncbi:prostaglandin E2 receptor EP1 subtype-like [Girardinichthys multiradiatus]|uniref:prostaglandin E2 receptor EP1 subtype-like n=1 Tax=Girardinichthys multiradiatus TaxID=208333 RepID=UPI001FAB880C|nr:prostaglandin E2 receptor EP1 subtype-like [Girardinichthys multiradiatus]
MMTPSAPVILISLSTMESYSSNESTTNTTSRASVGLEMSCFTMIFGAISNLTALGILARSRGRFRRQSKKSFLLLTVALLLADLLGHVILGAFALHVHLNIKYKILKRGAGFCNVFGASMVFFGLCSLLLGCAMAVERWVAITRPFFHDSMITVAHAQSVVLFLSSFALVLAILPFFSVGYYTTQDSNTWCFFPIHNSELPADKILVLVFSCLGLFALFFSLLCNIVSGLALLHARIKSRYGNTTPSSCSGRRASSASSTSFFCSLDVEMMVQLAAVTVVSCVCWGPFLIHIFIKQFKWDLHNTKDPFTLLTLRMAAWNQILDPWVYILLRRKVLSSLCCGRYSQGTTSINSFSESRRPTFTLQ